MYKLILQMDKWILFISVPSTLQTMWTGNRCSANICWMNGYYWIKKKKLAKGTGCEWPSRERRNGDRKRRGSQWWKWKKDLLPLLEVAQKVGPNEMSVYENWRVILASRRTWRCLEEGEKTPSIMGSRKTASVEQEDCPTVHAHIKIRYMLQRLMQICSFLFHLLC